MKINNVSLPYPVLGNSDDIVPGLPDDNIKVDVQADAERYHFTVHLHQENEDIERYIRGGYAEYFSQASWNASLKYDKLYAAGSFMVVRNGGEKASTWFDANDDTIKVFLPEELFRQFNVLCNDRNFNEVFHASIVFNALFKTLSEYREEKHGNWQWAEAIKYRISNEPELQDYDITDTSKAYELAQALLQDPYKRLFNHLKEQQNR